ncbi:MAG TPA: carboxypeptidase-like regulatory domain-containing protein [Gemmatimonadaceae bacterium]|nr:carboxypeptidase-like regulatory domain-containing protein [Gemmatimonadaceae bacterium]
MPQGYVFVFIRRNVDKELNVLITTARSQRSYDWIPLVALSALLLASNSPVFAQSTKIRVISADGVPIPFAWISVEGAEPVVSGENGEAAMTNVRHKTFTVEVRRIGYAPFHAPIVFPDTAAVIDISLTRVAQQLAGTTITVERLSQLALTGFYERAQMRQKGVVSGTFIGPEEMEKRHPSRISDMLVGRLGVSLREMPNGKLVARGGSGTCFMTILLDGHRLCPAAGCNTVPSGQFSSMTRPSGDPATKAAAEDIMIDLNQYIDPNDVTAIEIYSRGGNMPISLQTVDNACGVIAFWTGARK